MVSRREGVRTIGYVIEKAPQDEPRYTKKYKRRSRFDVLKKMEPGDSFVVCSEREGNLARAYALRHDMKVSVKRIDLRKRRVTMIANDN
jgi:hypothetical protein